MIVKETVNITCMSKPKSQILNCNFNILFFYAQYEIFPVPYVPLICGFNFTFRLSQYFFKFRRVLGSAIRKVWDTKLEH